MATTVTALSPEYSNEEKRVKYTHASAVTRHEAVVTPQSKVVVSQEAVDAATEAVFKAEGRFLFPKKAAIAFTVLQKVYLDTGNEEITDLAGLAAGTPAADAGNTGDGTLGSVTLGNQAQVGTYKAICTDLAPTLAAGAATADAGNTGDGTIGSITLNANAKAGTYKVIATALGPGVAAAGTSAAAAHNTGDGTITASPATGANAKAGVYTATCIVEAANAGYFEVRDPDGIYLGIATVAVEFSTGSHLTFTIADGATDFDLGDQFTITVANADSGTFNVLDPDGLSLGNAIVGVAFTSNQINLTIADGAIDFAVSDFFTIVVAGANGGTFNVLDPDGLSLGNATVGVAFTSNQINLTISDGATDFAVGDFFTIAVTQGNYDAGYCYEAADASDTTIHIYLKNNL